MTPSTLDPERLAAFVAELDAAGFRRLDDDGREFEGPLPASLAPFTGADVLRIVVNDGWPYVQPSVDVEGTNWWHATHERPCLWQAEDNTKRWLTLVGLLGRLDEWAEKAASGFTDLDGAALDPQFYFESYSGQRIGIDTQALLGSLAQDGQHDVVHLDWTASGFPTIAAGMGKGQVLWGRWFYRDKVTAPPRSVTEFEDALTDKQRIRLDKHLTSFDEGLFVLVWPTPHGLSTLALHVTKLQSGERSARALLATPLSQQERLRRAGPDAAILRDKRVVLFGVGAIGSHLGSVLARSGVGFLKVVDGDVMIPVVLVRHAARAVGRLKVDAFKESVAAFEWAKVETVERTTWHPEELAALITDADLCIDATGNSLFAELLSRVASLAGVAMITAALYRGGRIARVRREALGDHPIVYRSGHWKYTEIPAASDPALDYVGTETGCAAPIHNAPPASVMAAAALSARVAISHLTGRASEADEVIEILEPIEPPFDCTGRFTVAPPTVALTDGAVSAMVNAAIESHPRETGGILLGILDETGAPCVVDAVELRPDQPTTTFYVVPAGATFPAVDNARVADARIGYLGEWHSHPSDQPASRRDATTMARLANDPETGNPVLLVLRPRSATAFDIDAYIALNGRLRPTSHMAIGPLAPQEPR